jgi:hypothetical protein
MGDESWIYGYDPEKKTTIITVEVPTITKTKKGRQVWSSTKSMFIVFSNVKGILWEQGVEENILTDER